MLLNNKMYAELQQIFREEYNLEIDFKESVLIGDSLLEYINILLEIYKSKPREVKKLIEDLDILIKLMSIFLTPLLTRIFYTCKIEV